MLLRRRPGRLAAPAVFGVAVALIVGCKGEPVASVNTGALTSEQRANIAMRLVDAAGSGDGAAGAGLAASIIMSGAPVTRIAATRTGFASVARAEAHDVAADVTTMAEGAVYDVVAFQLIERTFGDTTMGVVAWNTSSDGNPTSFVVAYAFGEGTGHFDDVDGGPTAYGYVFQSPTGGWAATSGTASLLRKTVGADCDGTFQYPGVSALCRVATFTGALQINGTTALGDGATGSPTLSIESTPLNGVVVEVSPTTAAAIARPAR